MGIASPATAAEPEFITVADGVRAQVVRHPLLPPHLTSTAHEGRAARCGCVPLLEQLTTLAQWPVVPRGARAACLDDAQHHDLQPLRVAVWPQAPRALRQQVRGVVELTITMCRFCGAVEVRDVSFHVPAGLRLGTLAPRRRSTVLGWYSGKRPNGRTYI